MNPETAPQAACETTRESSPALAFHLSLHVADLERSIAFYRTLLDHDPVKVRSDYAKFETTDPPLVLSLERRESPPGGRLNHLGFRAASAESLVEAQRRLELAGHATIREEGVECCYARQSKFWARDPDGTMWEWYVFEGDIEERGAGRLPKMETGSESVCCGDAAASAARESGADQAERDQVSKAAGACC